MRNRTRELFIAALLVPCLVAVEGCHSYHIDSTVKNRTGAEIQLLEVDYPSASFGVDSVAAGADIHYRFQIRGNGPLKVQYTVPGAHQVQVTGPTLTERQEGQLEIVLLPDGKADFNPQLTPH